MELLIIISVAAIAGMIVVAISHRNQARLDKNGKT
jgi:hypothetical protein